MLKLIERIWEGNPDTRLLQLLCSPFDPGDLYHIEDSDLETVLKARYLGKHV